MIFFILIILFQLIDTVFLFQLIRLLKNNAAKNSVYVPVVNPVVREPEPTLTREDVITILANAGIELNKRG